MTVKSLFSTKSFKIFPEFGSCRHISNIPKRYTAAWDTEEYAISSLISVVLNVLKLL